MNEDSGTAGQRAEQLNVPNVKEMNLNLPHRQVQIAFANPICSVFGPGPTSAFASSAHVIPQLKRDEQLNVSNVKEMNLNLPHRPSPNCLCKSHLQCLWAWSNFCFHILSTCDTPAQT
jgi:hypothetical protein